MGGKGDEGYLLFPDRHYGIVQILILEAVPGSPVSSHDILDIDGSDIPSSTLDGEMETADYGINGLIEKHPRPLDDAFHRGMAAPDDQNNPFSPEIYCQHLFFCSPYDEKLTGG